MRMTMSEIATSGRLTIKKARFNTLEVDELTVRKLRVLEQERS
jgi:hypothetical protein